MTTYHKSELIPLGLNNLHIEVSTCKSANGSLYSICKAVRVEDDLVSWFPFSDYKDYIVVNKTIKRITKKAAQLQFEAAVLHVEEQKQKALAFYREQEKAPYR